MSLTAVRYLCLLVPVALTLGAARLERGRAARFAALLAFLTAAVGIAALNELARFTEWYTFHPVDGAILGMPVDLWLGWALLWGPIPLLLRRVLPLPVALGLLLWLDAVAMPQLRPLVQLGPSWLVGEVVGLLCVALPAQLLAAWSADRRRLPARVLMQLGVFTALVFWLLPTVVFEVGDGSWSRLGQLSGNRLFVLAQLGLLLAVPALAAVREFAVRGGGTPYPWDPPRRLVTTGPYGYVGNPMQVSTVGLLLLLAAATGSGWLAVTALASVAFGIGVAGPHERRDLDHRYGPQWRRYRAQVRDWWPRWRPYQSDGPDAQLWLDDDCGPCSAVGDFLDRRDPRRLLRRPATEHDRPLRRARYADDDGYEELGVAAVARALDHVALGWAYLGWLLRLPGVAWLAQLVTDAMIAPPHPTCPRGEGCPTPSSDSCTGPSPPSARTASPGSPPGPSPAPPG